MSEAEGSLREQCLRRDGYCCRFCGRHGVGLDAHHIRFRRGAVDDALWNLVSLCRQCHNEVHANSLLSKRDMQDVLWRLAEEPGITGMQVIRWNKRK